MTITANWKKAPSLGADGWWAGLRGILDTEKYLLSEKWLRPWPLEYLAGICHPP